MSRTYTDAELDQLIDLAISISLRQEEEALSKASEDTSSADHPLSPKLQLQIAAMIRRESALLQLKGP